MVALKNPPFNFRMCSALSASKRFILKFLMDIPLASWLSFFLFIVLSLKIPEFIEMKYHKINSSFIGPEGPDAWDDFLKYNTIHEFSLWLRTGFNPTEIHRMQSYTGWCFVASFFLFTIRKSVSGEKR